MRRIALFVLFVLFLAAPAIADDVIGVVGGPPVVGRSVVGTFAAIGFVDDVVQNLDGSVTLGIGLEGGRLNATCQPMVAAQCSAAFGNVSTFTGTVYSDGREVEAVIVPNVGG